MSGQPKGRRVAIWTGIAGLSTIAATGVLCRDRIHEEWLIHKLVQGSPDERADAASALGEMRGGTVVLAFFEWSEL
jgi:hypothetical protein